jgi:hypothetical protein
MTTAITTDKFGPGFVLSEEDKGLEEVEYVFQTADRSLSQQAWRLRSHPCRLTAAIDTQSRVWCGQYGWQDALMIDVNAASVIGTASTPEDLEVLWLHGGRVVILDDNNTLRTFDAHGHPIAAESDVIRFWPSSRSAACIGKKDGTVLLVEGDYVTRVRPGVDLHNVMDAIWLPGLLFFAEFKSGLVAISLDTGEHRSCGVWLTHMVLAEDGRTIRGFGSQSAQSCGEDGAFEIDAKTCAVSRLAAPSSGGREFIQGEFFDCGRHAILYEDRSLWRVGESHSTPLLEEFKRTEGALLQP